MLLADFCLTGKEVAKNSRTKDNAASIHCTIENKVFGGVDL